MECYSIDSVENSTKEYKNTDNLGVYKDECQTVDNVEFEDFFKKLYKPEQNNLNDELMQLMLTSTKVEKIIVDIICKYLNGAKKYSCEYLGNFETEMLVHLGFKINSSGTDLFWCGREKALATMERYHNTLGLEPSQLQNITLSIQKALKENVVKGIYTVSVPLITKTNYLSLVETQIKMYLKKFNINTGVKLKKIAGDRYDCVVTWHRFS